MGKMKRRFFPENLLVFILVIMAGINLHAQEHLRLWSEGPLTWKDFSIRDSTPAVSRLVYGLYFKEGRQRMGDTVILRYITIAAMDPQQSYFNRRFLKEEYLRYNQIIFDLVELYRRKLQYVLDRMEKQVRPWERLIQYKYELDEEIRRFKEESGFGQKPEVMDEWQIRIHNEWEQYPADIPSFQAGHWVFDYRMGMSGIVLGGSMGDYIQPGAGFEMDYGLRYRHFQSILLLSVTRNKILKPLDVHWTEVNGGAFVAVEWLQGYVWHLSSKHTLIPMAGIGFYSWDGDKEESEEKSFRYQDWTPTLGMTYLYRWRSLIRLIPHNDHHQIWNTNFGFQFLISKPDFAPGLNGYILRFGIFWGYDTRRLYFRD